MDASKEFVNDLVKAADKGKKKVSKKKEPIDRNALWEAWLAYMNDAHDLQYKMATGSSPYTILTSLLKTKQVRTPHEVKKEKSNVK